MAGNVDKTEGKIHGANRIRNPVRSDNRSERQSTARSVNS